MSFELIVWFLVAYALGAVPFGVVIARRHGVDLFAVGSGNIGATNVYRVLGRRAGAAVFALDVLKALIPALIVRGRTGSEEWALVAGICAVAGHSLSPFIGFRGGKGISPGLGALLGSSPAVALSALGTFLVAFGLSSYVSLASLASAIGMVAFGLLYARSPTMIATYVVFAIFVFYRHLPNIRRLLDGTEPKTVLGGSGSVSAAAEAKAEQEPVDPSEGGTGQEAREAPDDSKEPSES